MTPATATWPNDNTRPSPETRRTNILHALQARPGSSMQRLSRQAGIPCSTLRHHLHVLARQGRLWRRRIGPRLAHFPGPRPQTQQDRHRAVATTFDALDGKLYVHTRDHGPLAQHQLIEAAPTGVARSTIQHRLKRLVDLGILEQQRQGRCTLYKVAWQ